jgi:hypothetical protein
MWQQYWGLYEPRGPAKGPNEGLSPTPPNKKKDDKVWIGLIWLGIGTSGGLL